MNVNDGHTHETLQVVLPTSTLPKTGIGYHAGVVVSGSIVESSGQQEVELSSASLESVYPTSELYPFGPRKEYTDNYSRDFPHFRSKLDSHNRILRLRNHLGFGIHNFFQNEDFLQIQTPILTSNVCEGGGQVFKCLPEDPEIIAKMRKDPKETDSRVYFDKDVYLTVSGQLHLEAVANGLGRVYNFSPVFRAEMGRTRRHLTEFTMIEAEMAFMEQLSDLTKFIERFVKAAMEAGIKDPTLIAPDRRELITKCLTRDFITIKYDDLMDVLIKHSDDFKVAPVRGSSLGTEHELFACKYFDNLPVFVVNFPTGPFYARGNDTVDLLFPEIGELVGGSLRERDPDILEAQIKKAGIPLESLNWYVEMRRDGGAAPTGGFGLGFERLVKFMSGVFNIQDTVPFPRTPHNCNL